MIVKFIFFFIASIFSLQAQNTYLSIRLSDFSVLNKSEIILCSSNEIVEPIEVNFFKIKSKQLKQLSIKFDNNVIELNLDIIKNQRFIEVLIKPNINPENCDKVSIKQGDKYILLNRNVNDEFSKCNEVLITFPQIIIDKYGDLKINGSQKFKKYLF